MAALEDLVARGVRNFNWLSAVYASTGLAAVDLMAHKVAISSSLIGKVSIGVLTRMNDNRTCLELMSLERSVCLLQRTE